MWLGVGALAPWLMGEPDQAARSVREATVIAERGVGGLAGGGSGGQSRRI